MDVSTIDMPATAAKAELRAYRNRVHRAAHAVAEAEYREIEQGLEALAAGTPLIQLSAAFRDVTVDEQRRPRLAIARADRPRVLTRATSASFIFDTAYQFARRGREPQFARVVVPSPLARFDMRNGYALVPIVPPRVRDGHNLSKRFILWEVEQWADREIAVGPDRDPYLLQQISRDLYAVVGEWELTALEQAVLAGRAFR
jgi:hypothetical protein